MRTSAVRVIVVLMAVILTAVLALPGEAVAIQVGEQAPDLKLAATTGG